MSKFNKYGYGLLTDVDVELIEKSLVMLSYRFRDQPVNIVQIGGYNNETNDQICKKLESLGVKFQSWIIDDGQFHKIKKADNFKLIVGDSTAVYDQAPKEIHWLHIDGCHCCNHAMLDFLNYGHNVVDGGLILFHDTSPFVHKQHLSYKGTSPACSSYGGVDEAFKRLDIFNRRDVRFLELAYQEGASLGGVTMFKKFASKDKRYIEYQSRNEQDKWVVEKLDMKEGGYFVDIGAGDGIQDNNSHALEKELNWKGICVEPNPLDRSFKALIQNRNCICENECIFEADTEVDFIARGRKSSLSGITYECASSHIQQAAESGHPVTRIKSISLEQLLDRHDSPAIIDYLSLDTGGSEFDILRNFNFEKYKFLLITVDVGKKQEEIKKLLGDNGYELEAAVGSSYRLTYAGTIKK